MKTSDWIIAGLIVLALLVVIAAATDGLPGYERRLDDEAERYRDLGDPSHRAWGTMELRTHLAWEAADDRRRMIELMERQAESLNRNVELLESIERRTAQLQVNVLFIRAELGRLGKAIDQASD